VVPLVARALGAAGSPRADDRAWAHQALPSTG
jgi:hypothetical protein